MTREERTAIYGSSVPMTPASLTPPSPVRLAKALVECGIRGSDLVRAASPFGWPGPAQREQILRDLTAAAGADEASDVHDAFGRLFGRPLDPDTRGLDGEVDRQRTRRYRALAAWADVEVEVDRALAAVRRPRHVRTDELLVAAVVATWTAPPIVATRLGVRLARRFVDSAPPTPTIRRPNPDRANLLATLVADALPGVLGNAAVRHLVLRLPSDLVIGFRSGKSEATVTIGRTGVRVANGLGRNAAVIIDGNVATLLRHASGALFDEFSESLPPT